MLGDTNEGQPGSAALLGLYVSQGWAPGILRREGTAARAELSRHRMLGNDVLADIGGNHECFRHRVGGCGRGQQAMTRPKTAVRSAKRTRGRHPRELPVALASLRWALLRRLLLAVAVGLVIGGMLSNAFTLEPGDPGTEVATLGGITLSVALFLAVTWLLGRSRRSDFAAAGGDPQAASALLFGVLTPRRRTSASQGSAFGGGDSSGGDCGGGDGGGGGCD